jgi:hypothetical protein
MTSRNGKRSYVVRRWVAWLVAAALAGSLLHTMAFIARRLVNPRAQTFDAFAEAHGAPTRLVRARVRGHSYLIWYGTNADIFFRLASGPPCYIFDTSGTLVGWTPTTGDGELELLLSESYKTGEDLTVPEALEFLSQAEP